MKVILLCILSLLLLHTALSFGQQHISVAYPKRFPPVVILGNDTAVASGSSFVLNAQINGGIPPYTYLWSPSFLFNNHTLANPTITVATASMVNVTVNDAAGCSGSSGFNISLNTGLAEMQRSSFEVFPNPSQGIIRIAVPEHYVGMVVCSIYDLSGKKVWQKNANAAYETSFLELDCTHLSKQMYFVEIRNENQVSVQKIVIQ